MQERAARISELENLMNLLPATDDRRANAEEEYINLLCNPMCKLQQRALSSSPASATSTSSSASLMTPATGQKEPLMTPLNSFSLQCDSTASV